MVSSMLKLLQWLRCRLLARHPAVKAGASSPARRRRPSWSTLRWRLGRRGRMRGDASDGPPRDDATRRSVSRAWRYASSWRSLIERHAARRSARWRDEGGKACELAMIQSSPNRLVAISTTHQLGSPLTVSRPEKTPVETLYPGRQSLRHPHSVPANRPPRHPDLVHQREVIRQARRRQARQLRQVVPAPQPHRVLARTAAPRSGAISAPSSSGRPAAPANAPMRVTGCDILRLDRPSGSAWRPRAGGSAR